MIKVLFVCLGNICRSPLAEGIFKKLVSQNGLDDYFFVDSAGTSSYHCGSDPDPRSMEVAQKNHIILDHKAQQLNVQHLRDFDYIVPMDAKNMADITVLKNSLNNEKTGLILMMRNFEDNESGEDVPDPYFGEKDGFDHVFSMLSRTCKNFLEFLVEKHNIPL